MKDFIRFCQTIRYLKLKQIYFRFYYFFKKPFKNNISINIQHHKKLKLKKTIYKENSYVGDSKFFFLNEYSETDSKIWCQNEKSMLWQYNLHYFDFINSKDSSERSDKILKLMHSWVNEVSIFDSVGWQPYPSSLRIVNWIKWILKNDIDDKIILSSLAEQIQNVETNVEYHIMGNHLFANAKALLFGGIFFGGKRGEAWYQLGFKIFIEELDEQFLKDNGHFELSPMYHSIIIEDLLDVLNLAISAKKNDLEKVIFLKINGILNWLETMLHPDGNISLFNDSAFKGAAPFSALIEYAERLGVKYEKRKKISKLLVHSGYTRLENKDAVLFFDHGAVGPSYQPGHAHADTLSIELSLFDCRVITNLGISTYDRNVMRSLQRSTKSHSTLVVDNRNSSDVWASFRVGRRATTQETTFKSTKNFLSVCSEHNGYRNILSGVTHRRDLLLNKKSLIIKDDVYGFGKHSIEIYFHIYPGIIITKKSEFLYELQLNHSKKIISIKMGANDSEIVKTSFCLGFGKTTETLSLKLYDTINKKKQFVTTISWE